jgi:hypothetical protein
MTLPAKRDADGYLSVPLVPTDMRVAAIEDGNAVTLAEYGRIDTLTRIEPPESASSEAILGTYASPGAGLRAAIDEGEAPAKMTLSGALGAMEYALTPIGPELWEGRATGALPLVVLIEFGEDGFMLTSGRTQRLAFGRMP